MVVLYVLAFLYDQNNVLLVRRASQQFGKGSYSMVGGKVEPEERALHAIGREVREETGLDMQESDFALAHTFHRLGTEGPFVALVFKASIEHMHPENSEPDKHDEMKLFSLEQLPENLLPAHRQAIECILHNESYSEHGW